MNKSKEQSLQPIKIKGARVNNLKNVDVEIPANKLVVVTGVSGSGKTSLAFDTLFAEGQRRYVESLSSYARQFLGRMNKPEVDDISGIAPAIAVKIGNLAPQLKNGITRTVAVLSFSSESVLVFIMAGTEQPKPIIIGMNALPDKPNFLKILSRIKATRAI